MEKFDVLAVYGITAEEYEDFTDFVFSGEKIPVEDEDTDNHNASSTLFVSGSNLLAESSVNRDVVVFNGALKAPEVGDGIVIHALLSPIQHDAVKLEDGAVSPKPISEKEFLQGEKNVPNAIDIAGDIGEGSYLISNRGSVHVGGNMGKGGLVKLSSKKSTVHVEGKLKEDVIIDAGETGKVILDQQPGENCRFICNDLTIAGEKLELGSDGRVVGDKLEQIAEDEKAEESLPELPKPVETPKPLPIPSPQLLLDYKKEEIPKSLVREGDVLEGEELKARKKIRVTGNVADGASLKLTEPNRNSSIHVIGNVVGAAKFDAGKGGIILDKFPNLDSRFKCGKLFVGAIVKEAKEDGKKPDKPEILRAKCNVDSEGRAIIDSSIRHWVLGSEKA